MRKISTFAYGSERKNRGQIGEICANVLPYLVKGCEYSYFGQLLGNMSGRWKCVSR
ncbi:MAG: hypothetical protein ILA04_02755 [Prevotella sp.]|nr:hypothetical protein [Prevotella sp.]